MPLLGPPEFLQFNGRSRSANQVALQKLFRACWQTFPVFGYYDRSSYSYRALCCKVAPRTISITCGGDDRADSQQSVFFRPSVVDYGPFSLFTTREYMNIEKLKSAMLCQKIERHPKRQ